MRRLLALVVLLLLVAGCASKDEAGPSPSSPLAPAPEPLDRFSWTGSDCAELALMVDTAIANVRPHVHANFTVVDAGGMATVIVGFARCTSATTGENLTNNIVMSDVGVFIEDPDGAAAPAIYQFWHASNRAATYENISRVGLRTQAAPNSNFLTFGLVQATLAESRIAAVDGEYSASGTSVPGSAAVPPRSFRWWHASENGTMYTDFTLAYRSVGPARGNISIDADSDLARILGGTTIDAEGVYWTFDLATESRRATQ